MIRLRDLVCEDPVALEKWPSVVDHIVQSEADQRRVKKIFKNDDDYEQAVLESLNLWKANGDKRVDLLEVLRGRGLNALADKIEVEEILLPRPKEFRMIHKNAQTRVRGVWFQVGESTCSFTGRETELVNLHHMLTSLHSTESVSANIVSIYGLGGIGKSSLAKKYAFKYRNEYDGNVMWINAETIDSMKSVFVRLSTRLGVPTCDQDSHQELVARVCAKFQNQKSLFIFDNVEEKHIFKQFQPKIEDPANETPFVLITTRRNDVTPLPENQLNLGVLEMDEAMNLIRKQAPHAHGDEVSAIKLAEAVQRLPLALQQALAYIRDKYTNDGDCISKYLKEFEVSEQALLEDERFRENNDYSLTTYATWNITLTRIETMEGGQMATRVIEVLAYLNPDVITVQFLENVFKTLKTSEMELALKLLERFSMLSAKDGKISIHRLVQKVVRLSLSTEKEVIVLGPIIEVIRHQMRKKMFTEYTRECVSYGLQVFPYQLKHWELMKEESSYLSNLCYFVVYYGSYSDALNIANQSSLMYESMVGDEHQDTLKMKWKAADAYKYLENTSQAMEILESILPVSKSKLGQEHWLTMSILSSVAYVHAAKGDHQKAISIYDEVLPGRIRLYGKDSHNVLSSQQSTAISLRKLGHLDDALKLLQYIYEKRVELYGKKDLRTLTAQEHIGEVYISKQEYRKAAEMLGQVYKGRRKGLGEAHPFTARVKCSLERAETELFLQTQAQSKWRCHLL